MIKRAGEKQTEFKSETNEIVKAGKKIRRSKSAIKNIKTLYQSRKGYQILWWLF